MNPPVLTYRLNHFYGIKYPAKMHEMVSNVCKSYPEWAPIVDGTLTIKMGRKSFAMFMDQNSAIPAESSIRYITVEGLSLSGDEAPVPEDCELEFEPEEFENVMNDDAADLLEKLCDVLVEEIERRGCSADDISLGWFATICSYLPKPAEPPKSVAKKAPAKRSTATKKTSAGKKVSK